MKDLFSIAFLALLLSGCGNLYGPYNAPVVDRNIHYNQRPVTDINQPQQPRVVSQRVVSTQTIRTPRAPAPNQVAPVPAPVVGQAPVNRPPVAVPPPNNAAGWNARPQTGNTIVLVDEPKLGRAPTPAAPAAVPAPPVVRKAAEKALKEKEPAKETSKEKETVKEPLVDKPKLSPAPTEKPKEAPTRPAKVVPDEPKIAKKPEKEPEKPKRPAPLRPKTPNNTLEDSIVENKPAKTEQVASRVPAAPATGKTAVSSLLKKASASLNKGKLDEAVAYLENAQRIEPKNSKILYDIAQIRYHQGRYRDAENFAGKASQIGGGSMSKKAWRLISKSREKLGDKQGAIQAAEKAAQ